MMRLAFVAVAVAAFSFTPASAQDQVYPTGMFWVEGSCSRLITPDGDHSTECNKALALVRYSNGRTSYRFSIPKKSVIAFSGFLQGGKLNLDLVTIASTPTPDPNQASGSCTFDDPWKGPAHISCQGTTAAGKFAADFTTDSKPPEGKSNEQEAR